MRGPAATLPAPSPARRPGTLTLTGQVGEVLEESAQIALSWIRAHAVELGLEAPVATSGGSAGLGLHAPSQPHALDVGSASQGHGLHALEPPPGLAHVGPAHAPEPPPLISISSASGGPLAVQAAAAVQGGGGGAHSGTAVVQLLNPSTSWDVHVHLPAGAIQKVRKTARQGAQGARLAAPPCCRRPCQPHSQLVWPIGLHGPPLCAASRQPARACAHARPLAAGPRPRPVWWCGRRSILPQARV